MEPWSFFENSKKHVKHPVGIEGLFLNSWNSGLAYANFFSAPEV